MVGSGERQNVAEVDAPDEEARASELSSVWEPCSLVMWRVACENKERKRGLCCAAHPMRKLVPLPSELAKVVAAIAT